ncbi:MAG: WYL domain-containing protein [Clostridium sp.]|nr:WYL domain-containing protein [Clostridium sp.]
MDGLGNILKMIFILKTKKKVKIKSLADELDVSERQVRRYKNEIDKYFNIESITGSDGGYTLIDDYFPFKDVLTENEISKLKFLINSLNYENSSELMEIVDKLNLRILKNEKNYLHNEEVIHYSKPKLKLEEITKIYNKISSAIENRNEIILEYCDNHGNCSRRKVQPHKLLLFRGEYYLVSTCLLRNEIRYFKLTRIKEYIITGFIFERNIDIDEFLKEQEENNIGIYNGKEIDLELEITPPMANTIKERIWVDNQEIIEKNDGKIIYKARIKKGPEVISWILSMSDCVKVVSPESLRIEIKEKVEKILGNFNCGQIKS